MSLYLNRDRISTISLSTFIIFSYVSVTFWQFLYHISRYGISSDGYRTDTRGVARQQRTCVRDANEAVHIICLWRHYTSLERRRKNQEVTQMAFIQAYRQFDSWRGFVAYFRCDVLRIFAVFCSAFSLYYFRSLA